MTISYKSDLIMPFKEFLCATTCPDAWLRYDLYAFSETDNLAGSTIFYVGQSECAYHRVWQHIQNGFKGRSVMGKFLRVNWPTSMNFRLALFDSQREQFGHVAHDLLAAERVLIEALRPCFNDTYNHEPTPLPTRYLPPTASVKFPRHLGRMLREAEAACRVRPGDDVW